MSMGPYGPEMLEMTKDTHRGVREVRCVNRNCSELDVVKTVRLPHCGQGVYAGGQLVCGTCDHVVWQIQ